MTQQINYISIKDFKGIKDIEVGKLSRFVAIFWENGAGKTSFIEAIKNAIRAEKWVNGKVRKWAESWEIIVEFDDFKIKRIVWDRNKLVVEHDWELVSRPQEWLDWIFMGTIGDPQKFLNLTRSEKVQYLLETQWKSEAFSKLEAKRSLNFQARQDIHRTYLAKQEEIRKTEIDIVDFVEPEWNIDSWKQELNSINAHNEQKHAIQSKIYEIDAVILDRHSILNKTINNIESSEKRIEELKALIKLEEDNIKKNSEQRWIQKQSLDEAIKTKTDLQNKLSSFQVKDPAAVLAKIEEFNKKQEEIADIKAKIKLHDNQKNQAADLQKQWRELDNLVKNLEDQQNTLVSWLNMSYPMKVQEGKFYVQVWSDRLMLDELNKALQLEIWIDACLNWPNKIKIITIEDANSLDPQTLQRIKDKVEKADAQCFLETVYTTWYEEIIIKDWEKAENKNKA